MKITLEKPELIQLIGKSLGYVISEDDVEITAEPFEVSISNVNLQSPPTPPPAEGIAEEKTPQNSVLTMGDILNRNSTMGGPKPPAIVVEEDVPLTRNLGPLETEEPPPVTQAEIAAILRGN